MCIGYTTTTKSSLQLVTDSPPKTETKAMTVTDKHNANTDIGAAVGATVAVIVIVLVIVVVIFVRRKQNKM